MKQTFKKPATRCPLYVVGVDLGQSYDPTAIAVVERRDKWEKTNNGFERETILHVRHLERLELGTDYPTQAAYVGQILRRSPLSDHNVELQCLIDYTGVGRAVFDIFSASGIRVKGVTITGGDKAASNSTGWSVPKQQLISTLQARFHTGDLKISKALPDAETLVRELQEFRVQITAAGNPTFGARIGAHDDLVLALAMAVWRATQGPAMQRVPLAGV